MPTKRKSGRSKAKRKSGRSKAKKRMTKKTSITVAVDKKDILKKLLMNSICPSPIIEGIEDIYRNIFRPTDDIDDPQLII